MKISRSGTQHPAASHRILWLAATSAACALSLLVGPAPARAASATSGEQAEAEARHRQELNQEFPRPTPASIAAQKAQVVAGLRVLAAHGAPKARMRLVEWHFQQGEHVEAMTRLAEALRVGDLDARDFLLRVLKHRCFRIGIHQAEKFIYEYQFAAAHDDPFGLTMMGVFWDRGFSPLEPITAQAVRHYERAADAGSTWAMTLLGNLYEQGRGPEIPASPEKAAAWYARAGLEEPLAAARLAALHRGKAGWPGRTALSPEQLRSLDAEAATHPEPEEAACPAMKD